MMKKILILSLLLLPLLPGCKKPDDPKPVEDTKVTLTLADASATPETKALYANLWALREKGWMFGHHDDLTYGRNWQYVDGGSDTKDVCGDYPAVYGVDLSKFMDDRVETATEENAVRLRCMKQAYNRGMVILACMHLNNPLTGGDAWDNDDKTVVAQILTDGSATQVKFNQWLDRLATLAKGLKGDDGKIIPIIIRPFHEHTQDWSWWGSTCTTDQEFINLWKYFVDYMKKAGVHSFIYAISPQLDKQKDRDYFLFRWPGDDYVDFIGMDCYQGINNNVFVNNLKVLSALSEEKKKPAGVTETGVEGFQNPDYWYENIAAPMAGRKMINSFMTLYERSDTYFCEDLPPMYEPVENITVQ